MMILVMCYDLTCVNNKNYKVVNLLIKLANYWILRVDFCTTVLNENFGLNLYIFLSINICYQVNSEERKVKIHV